MFLEVAGVSLHLDGGQPLLHRVALQRVLGLSAGTAVLASARLWLGPGGEGRGGEGRGGEERRRGGKREWRGGGGGREWKGGE